MLAPPQLPGPQPRYLLGWSVIHLCFIVFLDSGEILVRLFG